MAMANNFVHQLREIFPNKSEETIQHILQIIYDETPTECGEIIFENAVNLLSESGCEADGVQQEDLSNQHMLSGFYDQLVQIFPDCCNVYLRELVEKNAILVLKNCVSCY